MSGFSNDLAQKVISHFFRNVSITAPASHYLAFFTSDPTDVTATALTKEVSAPWYARELIAFDAPSDAADVTTANTAQILFDAVTGSAVTVTHWGVFDALTSGNLQASGEWAVPKVLNVGDIPAIASGELILSFD